MFLLLCCDDDGATTLVGSLFSLFLTLLLLRVEITCPLFITGCFTKRFGLAGIAAYEMKRRAIQNAEKTSLPNRAIGKRVLVVHPFALSRLSL
jgi:hypothetical protein